MCGQVMGCVGEWQDTTWRGDTAGRYMERHGVDALEFCGQEVSGGMQWLTEGHQYGRGRHTKCGG